MEGRTVLAIAHRLASLRDFDRIVVMRGGRIIEEGPPNQLIVRNGAYRALLDKERRRLSAEAA
jgi:ATP-binding cassette subfamily B protein